MNTKDEMIAKIAESVGWTSDSTLSLPDFIADQLGRETANAAMIAKDKNAIVFTENVTGFQVGTALLVSAMTQLLALQVKEN